jgi:hypothetical protein
MKSRAQHVALELGLPLKDFVKLAESSLGLHINNLNMMLSAEHVAQLKLAVKRAPNEPHPPTQWPHRHDNRGPHG